MAEEEEFNREVSKGSTADFLNIATPFSEMESQLSAAPLCLAILGQVNLIATGGHRKNGEHFRAVM